MIVMLNCSFKGKKGNTQYFLELLESELKEYFGKENSDKDSFDKGCSGKGCSDKACEFWMLKSVLKEGVHSFAAKLQQADALVIGAPLYVDGLPAQAVKLLEVLLEEYKGKFPNLPVYVVSNLGFYEGMQTRHLFSIVENWCKRMGTVYGGGLVVGAGPMISTVKSMPLKTGLNKDIGNGLMKMAATIAVCGTMENYYCKTGIPRFVYMKAAHMSFRKNLKVNNFQEDRK